MAARDDGLRRSRLLLAGSGEAMRPEEERPDRVREFGASLRRRLGGRVGHEWWCLPGGVLLGLLGASVLPVVAGALAVPLVRRRLRAHQERKAAEDREEAVIGLCAAVSGELRAGTPPDRALLAAGADGLGDHGAALLAAARFGGDIPEALRKGAALPGADGLRGAAACWQVAAGSGAGLAEGMDRVAAALRAERDQRDEVRAQLAGPRATAVLLALLPVFGLLLGSAMGADPLRMLLHSAAGLSCLAVGVLLEFAGLAWVARIVRAAEGGGPA
ncbi:hypothetical protein DVA86_14215 [Streptomyces armeniacus]|uniref:Type II secretion system protein GspF domain-containing protein n=1 Tax=Streptomyces armeniacus TaxID=83291 RepID=A0A345Y0B2_9ACTN|nr:type II secretion system F family protein [Streptomyces armeniacus]AXK37328.1 hypothetical protein DVA86_14215 [Streptomyces armeniacus]